MTTTPEKSFQNEYSSSSNYNKSLIFSTKSLIKKIFKLFNKKYSKMPLNYNINIIDNIIYNEKSHIVATFKDRLIIDDTGEFLKRYYKKKESDVRLPKFYEYYDLYSKIFPNYTTFYEGKYLYQNIQRKQRMIDLQEKLEMEGKNNKEKNEYSRNESQNKENVFNTDAIDSILNGTNNEGMEIIFNVNRNNIKQDEDIFNKEINSIIDIINVYENKNKENKKDDKNKDILNNNNINKDNTWNKNISLPINLNYSKNKRVRNSNLMSTINNTNITYYNNIQSIISKFFNIPSHQKNNFLNLHNNTNKNKKINSKIKYYQKKDKNLVERIEQNLFKKRQKSIGFQKNLSQNISTSNQTQKDISVSKRNSSIYNKKPSSSTSSAHNQRNKIKKNIINSSSYKISNNNIINTIIKNKKMEIGKKGNSPLTSRNPQVNKIGLNFCKTKIKTIKNIKGKTCYAIDITRRNKNSNNINCHNKAKSTLRGSVYCNSSKIKENKNSNSKTNRILNNTKNKFTDSKNGKEIGYKDISFLRNGIISSKNKNKLKDKLLNNEMKISNSRNKNKIKNKNLSQPRTLANKNNKNISRNDSSLRLKILDIMNIKKKYIKGINIKNFSKALNISNINAKNTFSKTHRNSFGLFNK